MAYNPISLNYDPNEEGEKLRLIDEEQKVKRLVRAYNMDHQGNSRFNPLNGIQRGGVDSLVPENLTNKYRSRVEEFEDHKKIKVPHTSENTRKNIFFYY